MWEQIKQLFQGAQTPVVIEPKGYDDGLLKFTAQEPIKLEKMKVAAPCKKGYMEMEINVLSYEEERKIYRGKLSDEQFALDAMQIKRNRDFRLEVSVPVTSPEIKGNARTEDLGLDGARLLLKPQLERGSHITIKLHFNDPTVDNLELRCEVKWCLPTRKGLHHCAVRFFMIEKGEKIEIKRFVQNRVAMGGRKG